MLKSYYIIILDIIQIIYIIIYTYIQLWFAQKYPILCCVLLHCKIVDTSLAAKATYKTLNLGDLMYLQR